MSVRKEGEGGRGKAGFAVSVKCQKCSGAAVKQQNTHQAGHGLQGLRVGFHGLARRAHTALGMRFGGRRGREREERTSSVRRLEHFNVRGLGCVMYLYDRCVSYECDSVKSL